MMLARIAGTICLMMMAFATVAAPITVGQRLPLAVVTEPGTLLYTGGEVSYAPWNSVRLAGKVRVIMHLAGRLSAKDLNAPLTTRLAGTRFPADRYQTTLIVNTDDAIPGSAMFVRASLKSSKAASPETEMIIDGKGAVRKSWQLMPGGSAVVVLDARGNVRFAKDGALTPDEVAEVMALLNTLLT